MKNKLIYLVSFLSTLLLGFVFNNQSVFAMDLTTSGDQTYHAYVPRVNEPHKFFHLGYKAVGTFPGKTANKFEVQVYDSQNNLISSTTQELSNIYHDKVTLEGSLTYSKPAHHISATFKDKNGQVLDSGTHTLSKVSFSPEETPPALQVTVPNDTIHLNKGEAFDPLQPDPDENSLNHLMYVEAYSYNDQWYPGALDISASVGYIDHVQESFDVTYSYTDGDGVPAEPSILHVIVDD